MELAYMEKGAGKPLILLHGNGEDSSYFRHQIDFFSTSRRVIAIDTRGHGRSPRGSAPFTISQFADDLLAFFDRHEIMKPDVLGFSDGGNIALTFALRYPDRVDRLILNGANLHPSGVKPAVQIPIVLGYHIASMFASKSENARLHAEGLGLMVHEPKIDPRRLRALRNPVLVITGKRDMIKDAHSRLIAENLPNAVWRRINGDHFIAAQNPDVFNQTVAEFLQKEYASGIRCVALDLDGTALTSDKRMTESLRSALAEAIGHGIHIVVASGRAYATLPQEVLDFEGVEYAITSNGAAVYHIPTDRCLHRTVLSSDSVEKILEMTEQESVAYEVFVDGKAYATAAYVRDPIAFGASASSVPYVRSTREPVEDIKAFMLAHKTELDAIDIVVQSDEERVRIEQMLKDSISDIYITASVSRLLEICHRDCGKHSGLQWLLKQLDIPAESAAAFGDGDNDADLLCYVGTGIAVANASNTCMEAADFVTRSNDEDGVAYGLREILRL